MAESQERPSGGGLARPGVRPPGEATPGAGQIDRPATFHARPTRSFSRFTGANPAIFDSTAPIQMGIPEEEPIRRPNPPRPRQIIDTEDPEKASKARQEHDDRMNLAINLSTLGIDLREYTQMTSEQRKARLVRERRKAAVHHPDRLVHRVIDTEFEAAIESVAFKSLSPGEQRVRRKELMEEAEARYASLSPEEKAKKGDAVLFKRLHSAIDALERGL